MDNSILMIIIGSTLIFIGLVVWKIWWLLKKIPHPESTDQDTGKDQ